MTPVRIGAAVYYAALRASGIAAVRRRLQEGGPVLCYHNVVADDEHVAGDPGLHMSRSRFERQMRWLISHYDVVPLPQLAARLRTGRRLGRAAAVTFDDAYAGVFEHALPVLRGLGIPATVFVVSEASQHASAFWWDAPGVVASLTPEQRHRWLHVMRGDGTAILSEVTGRPFTRLTDPYRAASWATIRAHAGRDIDLGAHSVTHRALPTLTDAEIEHEVRASGHAVYEATGRWPHLFAYPYGLSDSRVRAYVREAGYRAAFGLTACQEGDRVDPWCMSRVNVPSHISDNAFEAWASGLGPRRPAGSAQASN